MSSVATITGRRHRLVTQCRQLAAAAGDDTLVLLDGEHLVRDALAAGVRVRTLLATEIDADLVRQAAAAGAEVVRGTREVLEAASPVRTSSGIVGIAEWPGATLDEALGGERPLVIGLAGIQDPGNVGAIIRSADALGGTGVVAVEGTADPRSWKALRGAMGSTFRLPVARAPLADVVALAGRRGIRMAATAARAGLPLETARLEPPLLIWLGREGGGLDPALVNGMDMTLHLHMRPGVDSLNVAVTAALVLYEARRQAGPEGPAPRTGR